jgi:hypothetical protein
MTSFRIPSRTSKREDFRGACFSLRGFVLATTNPRKLKLARLKFGYTVVQRGSGGIGRRASLRSWWPKGRRGSSPFFRTIFRFEFIKDALADLNFYRAGRARVDGAASFPYTLLSSYPRLHFFPVSNLPDREAARKKVRTLGRFLGYFDHPTLQTLILKA